MAILPGGDELLRITLGNVVWLAILNRTLSEPWAEWIACQLVATDMVVAAALTSEGQTQLLQQGPPAQSGVDQAPVAVVSTELIEALTNLLYVLDRGYRTTAAEVVSARWALLGALARAYPVIAELLTPAARAQLLGETR